MLIPKSVFSTVRAASKDPSRYQLCGVYLERVADRVRRRGARGARGEVRAFRAEADGNMPGGEVDDGGWNEEG